MDELGIPSEYVWEGLDEERISAYYDAKERMAEDLQSSFSEDPSLIERVPPQAKEMMKGLLLRRAVSLVHVLKPIEEQRRSMHLMQMKGLLPENHYASFQHADEMCTAELKSVIDESQLLAPECPPNAIIGAAVKQYHEERSAEGDQGTGGFEDVRKGFFNNSSKKKDNMAHGFEIGSEVVAHSLKLESLNGARGRVTGKSDDRVVVSFPNREPAKLKPANLMVAPVEIKVHPDATEVPFTEFHIELLRKNKEPLGLVLAHDPPLDAPQRKQSPDGRPGCESCLVVEDIKPDGYAKTYNDSQQDEAMRIRKGDRLLAVLDLAVPEAQRAPVGGDSGAILKIVDRGTPIVFFGGRVAGKPLRFKVGQIVKANCGSDGWPEGNVVQVWEQQDKGLVPYVIRLKGTQRVVVAPTDADDFVQKGAPRFKVGDLAMANYKGSYKKSKVVEVKDEKTRTSYEVRLTDGGESVQAPEDLDRLIRPIARFKEGTKVLANVDHGFSPGKVERCYHTNWVYAVRLDKGNLVYAPEDVDTFVKKA